MRIFTVTLLSLLLSLLLSACASAPKKDLALERVKSSLNQLKQDESLRGLAPLALGDAERALRQAELASGKETLRFHLIYMADRRIQIARTLAQRERLEQQYIELERSRNQMLVTASRLEAEQARQEAEQARLISQTIAEDAARAREQAASAQAATEEASRAADMALEEAAKARELAKAQAESAALAKREAALATEQMTTLRRQLENLQLRQTESGVVVTLGDVLFETGEADLKQEAKANLDEVVDLLQGAPEKNIRIEGHTDAVGSATVNLQLSEQRAAAVRDALADLGISAERMTILGLGEDFPIASNDTPEGRQQNRRVDVILLDG